MNLHWPINENTNISSISLLKIILLNKHIILKLNFKNSNRSKKLHAISAIKQENYISDELHLLLHILDKLMGC